MSEDGRSRPRSGQSSDGGLSTVPMDVVVGFLWLGVAAATTLLATGSAVRVFAALVTVTVLPGYALTTAVFPRAREREERSTDPTATGNVITFTSDRPGRAAITGVERAALSFGLSIAVLPALAFVTEYLYGGYDLVGVLIVLTSFVVLAFAVGVVRRWRAPVEDRYDPTPGAWLVGRWAELNRSNGWELALNVALVAVVVISSSMLVVAVVAPQDGTQYTEAYVLAEQPSGEWAAKNYPTEMQTGDGTPLRFVLSNGEDTTVNYTVVVTLQRLDGETVIAQNELRRFRHRLSADETWRNTHEVTPEMTGDGLRLTYLVYRGEAPSDPSVESAYRSVSLRVDVGG